MLNLILFRKSYIFIIILLSIYITFVFLFQTAFSAQPPQTPEERAALQAELAELETKIAEYERETQGYRQRGATLTQEINRLNTQINRTNLQIRAANLELAKLDGEINETETKLGQTESNIDQNRIRIASTLRTIERKEEQNIIEILLGNPSLSYFFGDINNVLMVQHALSTDLENFKKLRDDYLNQKEQLTIQKADAESLRVYRESQRRAAESTRRDRNQLLAVTRGREAEYQRLLRETRQSASEIRARLFRLMDGGAMTFEQAYEHARFAEGATGIRAALLLGVLDQESGLGRNVGRCTYQRAMHPRRDIPHFYTIIAELGMQAELAAGRVMVSCPIPRDGAFGGAMGPAQFIPSTWMQYRTRVSAITQNRPSSPWNNRDAFVAAGLLLRDNFNSTACRNYGTRNRHVLPEQRLRERCAAAMYYSGGNWHRFRFIYGDPVLRRADRFERDIATMRDNQARR